jgi:uncharacterized tellurite resistance protein B-like protein
VINRVKALFRDLGGGPGASGRRHSADQLHLAAAALLVEAARMDDTVHADERETVLELVRKRFALSAEESQSLLAAAEDHVDHSTQLHAFTKVVNKAFGPAERIELMEMLWEVTYIDGELHDFEASLMRRLAGLLHVTDRDSGAARNRVLARLGRA